MNEADIEKYRITERTEEVKDIIERMPSAFGYRITIIVVFVFGLMMLFGWIVKYPDIITGQITINTPTAPIKLVANTSGKIHLKIKSSQTNISAGDVVAYIENATPFDTLLMIKNILNTYNPATPHNTSIVHQLPDKVALGELTTKYYTFLSSLHQMINFSADKLYDKQIGSLMTLHQHQVQEIANTKEQIDINNHLLRYSEKFKNRDSILHAEKVAAELEFDKSKINYLSGKSNMVNAESNRIEAEKQAQQTLSKITEINIQKSEKRKELELALGASYNDLMDYIAVWEQRYLFVAPFAGQVQFLKFWSDKQFIQSGEPVFTIIPSGNQPYGQVILPAQGAGKLKVQQEVIVKLDDYPYNEYGSVKGLVNNISLTTNTEKTGQGSIETYLVSVNFPQGLTTNYNQLLAFRHEAKGSAEIITKDRRLIERLFDNLKYVLNK
ncbi:MAG: HlyD family efflux transporter periplasmic adaptor subunit [Chitinophagaceae bacterium]|nr:MAG: HlyD family efflux transporter periplasmic adaptor subunit [Chitinophagaceae bacterium]